MLPISDGRLGGSREVGAARQQRQQLVAVITNIAVSEDGAV